LGPESWDFSDAGLVTSNGRRISDVGSSGQLQRHCDAPTSGRSCDSRRHQSCSSSMLRTERAGRLSAWQPEPALSHGDRAPVPTVHLAGINVLTSGGGRCKDWTTRGLPGHRTLSRGTLCVSPKKRASRVIPHWCGLRGENTTGTFDRAVVFGGLAGRRTDGLVTSYPSVHEESLLETPQ